jgi:nicotinamidase-related amidase
MNNWEMKGKPALLILHMQPGIIGEKFHPDSAKAVKESGIIPRQQALLGAFRNKKLTVIYVNVKMVKIGGDFPVYGFLWKLEGAAAPTAEEYAVISEVAPQAGELVLYNWPFGPFSNSGLEQALKTRQVDTLVAAGFATNGVVLGAIEGAADRYFNMIVPSDASASPSIKAHEAVMKEIAPAIAMVTTAEDIIAHL